MADDLSRVIGRLEAGFDGVKEHLERQDAQHAADKNEARQDRERRHAENLGRFNALERQQAETHAIATENHAWIKVHGIPMADEWARSKERKRLAAAEARGGWKTYAKFGAGASLLITGIGYLGKDAVAGVLRKIASLLG